jgi:proton glutamate symport protein
MKSNQLLIMAGGILAGLLSFFLPANGIDVGLRVLAVLMLLTAGFQINTMTFWIIISLFIGIEIGIDFKNIAIELNFISKIFIQLIKTIIAPLLFATLVFGIAGHSDLKQVGRMGWKSLVYFEIVTTIALFIGLIAINLSQAGAGLTPPDQVGELPAVKTQTWQEIIIHIFPENIAKSIANNEILQLVVFSILFSIGLSQCPDKHRQPMLRFVESLSEVMFKFTGVIMYMAPVAVGAAIAYTVGKMGLDILGKLVLLLSTLYLALIAFLLLVLLPIALIARVPIQRFIQAIGEPVSLAFATTSSEAALPKAMTALEKLGVPRKIVAFVMPTGYSFNLDGTTLYLALAAIFVAQAGNITLDWGTQLTMVLSLMLTSKGVAGVPRASLVILSGTVASFNLPEWPIFLILGIDPLMDMARTSVNVIGNCLATCVVARWEGEFYPENPSSITPEPIADNSH